MVTADYSPVLFFAIWDVTDTAVETSLRMADAEKARSRSRPDEAPIKTTEAQRQYSKVAFAVAAYATCSASMLIVNKLCITYLPAPTVVPTPYSVIIGSDSVRRSFTAGCGASVIARPYHTVLTTGGGARTD